MISSLIESPPILAVAVVTMPPNEMMPTSVVPPPKSTIALAVGSFTGNSAPIAAATGSSIKNTSLAPHWRAAS